jgi:hypothetical protein
LSLRRALSLRLVLSSRVQDRIIAGLSKPSLRDPIRTSASISRKRE